MLIQDPFLKAEIQKNKQYVQIIQADQIELKKLNLIKLYYNKCLDVAQNPQQAKKSLDWNISSEDLQTCQGMVPEERGQIFIQLVDEELRKFQTKKIKKGSIQMQSLFWKKWKDKLITLDGSLKSLFISSSNQPQNLNILTYKLEWIGTKYERYVFQLISTIKENHYQEIMLGHKKFFCSLEWFKMIRQEIGFQLTKEEESQILNEIIGKQNYLKNGSVDLSNNYSRLTYLTANNQSEITPQLKSTPLKKTFSHPETIDSPKSHNSKSKIVVDGDIAISSPPSLQTAHSHENPQQYHHQQPVEEYQSASNTQQSEKEKDDFKSIIEVEQATNNELENNKIPLIFQDFIPRMDIDQLQNEFNYKLVLFKDKIRLLSHQENPRRFKVIMTLDENAEKIFSIISNPQSIPKWNEIVTHSQVISLMKSDNIAIVYQKHRAYGTFYLPRDYVYLRYVFQQDNVFYMIDKSMENENVPVFQTIVRGAIENSVWCFVPNSQDQQTSLIILDIEINNGGLSSQEQDAKITKEYLSGLANFPTYARQIIFESLDNQAFFSVSNLALAQKKENQKIQDSESQRLRKREEKKIPQVSENNKDKLSASPPKNEAVNEEFNQKIDDAIQIIDNDRSQDDEQETKKQEVKIEEQDEIDFKINQEYKRDQRMSLYLNDSLKIPVEQGQKQEVEKILNIVKQEQHWEICINRVHQLIADPLSGSDSKKFVKMENDETEGHYHMKNDWNRDAKSGKFYFVNKDVTQNLKNVINFILQSIGGNLLKGQSILGISLPIDVFERRSNLERFAYSFSFAPIYLGAAAQEKDTIQQMKYVIAFLHTTSYLYVKIEKPFNPILGQTYQGWIGGVPVYFEQISHHPPICAFQVCGLDFKLQGYLQSFASIHANSVTGMNFGKVVVKIPSTDTEYILVGPPGEFYNTTFGDRYLNVEGKMFVYEKQSGLFADINYGIQQGFFSFGKKNDKPIDTIEGAVYAIKEQTKKKFLSLGPGQYHQFEGLNLKEDLEVPTPFSIIEGIWNQYLEIDQQIIFAHDKHFPYCQVAQKYPLASDAIFREDCLYWKLNDQSKAQQYKESMEKLQRNDRKLREEYQKKIKQSQQSSK